MSVASRYAKSLIDLAIETKQLEEVRNDMRLIKAVCKSNPDFVNLLESPIVKTDKKMAILTSIFEGKISIITQTFLKLIATKRRESYIDDMAISFDEMYKSYLNITTVKVESAIKLDDNSRNQILEIVKQSTKGEIELVEKVNPELIGGFILTINDTQVDQSVRRRLSELKKNFSNNFYTPSLN